MEYIHAGKAMEVEVSGNSADTPARIALEGDTARKAAELLAKVLPANSQLFQLVEKPLAVTSCRSLKEAALEADAHILVVQAAAGDRAEAHVIRPLVWDLERKRRERPFLCAAPSVFALSGPGLEMKIAEFLTSFLLLERGSFPQAAEIAGAVDQAAFHWISGLCSLWEGSFTTAFDRLSQIAPPEDGNQVETWLFKAAVVTGCSCLLEGLRSNAGGSSQTLSPEMVTALLSGAMESVDAAIEPELAGMLHYSMGQVEEMGSPEKAIEWYARSLDISTQISVYAEAAAALSLARSKYHISSKSGEGLQDSLLEVERLLARADIVYTSQQYFAPWLELRLLSGQVSFDLSEYQAGRERAAVLSRSVESFSLVVEALDDGRDEGKWSQAISGLCASMAALGASLGGEGGLSLVDQALSLLDEAAPRMELAPGAGSERMQAGRAGAMLVKKSIEKSLGKGLRGE